ncbi:MAG: hypothetical protein ACRDLA_10045 [Thermoleophilaceae bacterium]
MLVAIVAFCWTASPAHASDSLLGGTLRTADSVVGSTLRATGAGGAVQQVTGATTGLVGGVTATTETTLQRTVSDVERAVRPTVTETLGAVGVGGANRPEPAQPRPESQAPVQRAPGGTEGSSSPSSSSPSPSPPSSAGPPTQAHGPQPDSSGPASGLSSPDPGPSVAPASPGSGRDRAGAGTQLARAPGKARAVRRTSATAGSSGPSAGRLLGAPPRADATDGTDPDEPAGTGPHQAPADGGASASLAFNGSAAPSIFFFSGLALLAYALALVAPRLFRRLPVKPASWRPVDFVSRLERPG